MDDETAKRAAENEATFRRYNEEIERSARELGFTDPIPFICECAVGACREIVRLTDGQYESVRADATHFFVAPGHDSAPGEFEVVERHDHYLVLEKTGAARRIVVDRDPRTPK